MKSPGMRIDTDNPGDAYSRKPAHIESAVLRDSKTLLIVSLCGLKYGFVCQLLFRHLRFVTVVALFLAPHVSVVAAENAFTVPVRVLPAPQPEPPAPAVPGMTPREEPEPATPGARLPQYQLHHLDRGESVTDASRPELRFILALPKRPLIIEAKITIDGQPFAKTRDQRVQEILEFAEDPEKFKARLARWENAKAAAAQLLDNLKTAVTDAINTNSTAPSENAEEQDAEEADEDGESEPEVPVVPEFVNPKSIYERIERYMAATGQRPTAEEIHWLLTNWVDGPVVLFLKDNFQRFRADQKPVYKVLDRDRDGYISAKELEMAVASFWECDLNRNEIVEATELAEVVDDPREKSLHAGQTILISRLPSESDALMIYRQLAACYSGLENSTDTVPRFDVNQDGKFSAQELEQLHRTEADITLSATFNTRRSSKAALSIDGFGAELSELRPEVHQNPFSMTVVIDGNTVDFLAVQGQESDQVSIGAVNDGYPMLPVIDPNDDGRFTIRELRELNRRLNAFDDNGDGRITPDETHSTIRVCFGLGPTVHRQLAVLRSIQGTDSEIIATGPEWFQQMDRNNDNDISPGEFSGTKEQFAERDTDSDDLISVQEAIAAEKQP